MCTRALFVIYYLSIFYVGYCFKNQSEILFDLYNSTNGAHWFRKWDISTIYNNPCNGTLWGVGCDSNQIVQLNLTANNLNGTLPESIANLTYLLEIDMRFNELSGTIPNHIFNISTMAIIKLSHNKFSGSFIIPNNIGNINNLTELHLNHNQLSGVIPLNIDFLTNLKILTLNNNKLSSSIPSNIFNLQNLETLKLENNDLSSSIPSNFSDATNIQFAYFHNNNLNAGIPSLPSSIIGVTFHENDFTFNDDDDYFLEDFLMDLNHKKQLNAITIYNNRNLQGQLPIFNTSTLKKFMAHSCQITKTLTSSIYFLPSHISLINNRLSSTMPSSFITPYNDNNKNESINPLQIALFAQGNKLDFDIGWNVNVPLWIKQSILNTNSAQLFYTNQLKILEYVIIIIVFSIVLFLICYNIHRLRKDKKKKKDPKAYMELKKNDPLYNIIHIQPYSFFSQLKDIARYFYFAPALLFAVVTSILYFTSSNEYYSNADFLLRWSITYIGSATPEFNTIQTITLSDTISQWVASIYVVLYVAFTLYLYYIFYYRFTYPILFYQKMQITKSKISIKGRGARRKSSQFVVQSKSDSNDHDDDDKQEMVIDADNIYYDDNNEIYTLSGKKKKRRFGDGFVKKKHKPIIGSVVTRPRSIDEYYKYDKHQRTKLLDDKSQIFIPNNLEKRRYNTLDNEMEDSMVMSENSINLIYSPSDKDSISISDNSTDDDDDDNNNNNNKHNNGDINNHHQRNISNQTQGTGIIPNGIYYDYNEYQQQQQQSSYTNPEDQVSHISYSGQNPKENIMNDEIGINKHRFCCFCWYRNKRKLKRSFKTIFWSIMFLICEFLIIFYFGTISMVNDNTLNIDFNDWRYVILRYSVWIIIASCNSFIIPRISKKMVKKIFSFCFEWNRQEKLRKITIISGVLRSLNLVWIPMILLFFFHNDCGRYSNYYWLKCNGSYDNEFEFYVGNELISIKNSICSYGFFNNLYIVDYGKCFRSILEEWGTIIIFSSFGYIICMIGFWLYSVWRYHNKLKYQYECGQRKLGSIINVEYAEIWNHVQIVVIFGCSLPFVIPMIAFVLLINKWVYSSLLSLNFRLSDVNPYFPANLLIITNLLQQTIIILFMWFNDIEGRYFVICGDIIVDIAFLIWWFWYRNTVIVENKISKLST